MVEPKDSGQITKGKIDDAITALKDLKPKERDSLSDREAVRKMRRYIEKLTSDKYGYSYDEVSEMLLGLGIQLSGSRIKYLLGEVRKNTRRKKKPLENENPGGSESIKSATQNLPVNTASKNAASAPQNLPAKTTKSKRKNLDLVKPELEK
ncbi:MAG: hypothetical protein ACYTXE_33170 [Nostoc sp.]